MMGAIIVFFPLLAILSVLSQYNADRCSFGPIYVVSRQDGSQSNRAPPKNPSAVQTEQRCKVIASRY